MQQSQATFREGCDKAREQLYYQFQCDFLKKEKS